MTLPHSASGTRAGQPSDFYSDLRDIVDDALSHSIATDLGKTLERVAVTASSILRSRFVTIVVRGRDGGIEHVVARGATRATGRPADLDALSGLAARVVYDGQTVRLPDIALQAHPLGLPAAPAGQVRALLAVPVRSAGRVIGGLFAADPDDHRPFRRAAEHDARTLATGVGFLVDHARTTESLTRREQWLQASVEFGRELVADTHDNPMQMLVERILGLADADLATVIVPATDDAKMIIAAAAGEQVDEIEDRVLDRRGTMHDVLFDDHEPLIVDLSRSGALREQLDALDLHTGLLVPMPALPGHGGVLGLYRHSDRAPFTRAEVEMATTLSGQIVLAMELAGTRADRQREALLAERDRIARDLHDNIIQQLFATGMALQSVAGEVPGQAGERVLRAVDELDQTILQIRSTIYRLTTPTLGQGTGLRHQLDTLVSRLEEALGFGVDLEIQGPVDLGVGDDVAQEVVSVVQEALTNVAKHADASAARVSLSLRDNTVTLVVADDGKGLGSTTRRSGLANLRARAEALGGGMTLDSDSDGTRIEWRAPAGA